MAGKHFGLVVSLGILIFLAVFSPKKILIVKGYAVTTEQLDQGLVAYKRFCHDCHETGRHGAPTPYDRTEWNARLQEKGIDQVLANAALSCLSGKELGEETIAAATAYMITESRGQPEQRSGQRKAAL